MNADMILEALKVLVFGMLGIFFVMGMILLSVKILNFFKKSDKNEENEEKSE